VGLLAKYVVPVVERPRIPHSKNRVSVELHRQLASVHADFIRISPAPRSRHTDAVEPLHGTAGRMHVVTLRSATAAIAHRSSRPFQPPNQDSFFGSGPRLDAVLMAIRRRRARGTMIHSDQGTQFGSDAWRRFCRSNHLEPSMSRKGNCWDTQLPSPRRSLEA
jgi:hypothetical protein